MKKQNGITLIALVITIIVLLILAGITINLTIGQNGILTRASESKVKLAEAEESEGVGLAVLFCKMETATSTLKVTKDNLERGLRQELGNDVQFNIVENLNGSLIVEFNSGREYFVDTDGTIVYNENMYAISSVAQLKTFRDDVNNGNTYEGKYVYLENNIDLNNEEWVPIGLYLNTNSSPNDETNKPFKGIFDGRGYEVDKIYINTTDKAQGLFGLLDNGKIINLSIGENSNITTGKASGVIVGYINNNSIVASCSNKSNINATYAGGIVGYSNGSKILNCYNVGDLECDEYAGGIAGRIGQGSEINNSYNQGNVNGLSSVGGIVGDLFNSAIKYCYNTGNIIGEQYNIGGIAGDVREQGIINSCFNNGDITANGVNEAVGFSHVGGIVGRNLGEIKDVYNLRNISGIIRVGGIAGNNKGKIENAYNIGSVNGEINGGIVGANNYIEGERDKYSGIIINSYALNSEGISLFGENVTTIGEECALKSAEELKTMAGILGSRFKNDENNINNGYPILSWQ